MTTTQHPSSKEDILNYLAKHGQASVQELADYLNISAQATRRHLKDLELEALIEHQSIQTGMGRPQHVYQLSEKGRDRLPARYGDFALSLLDTLSETVGREQVGTILRKQWERKALDYQKYIGEGTIQERVERLVELRRAEGYMAEWHPVDPQADSASTSQSASSTDHQPEQQFIITEYNCAISDVARSFPSVCGHELEMFEVALKDCEIERTHWLVNGEHRCGYLVRAKVSE